MRSRGVFSIVCALGPAFLAAAACGEEVRVLPPSSGIYHSAFPNFTGPEDTVTAERVEAFESLAGRAIAWAYFSNNWLGDIRFPAESTRLIHAHGSVPFVRLMARSTFEQGVPDPVYTMQRIIDGEFDAALAQWARDARSAGIPLMAEFGTEVNGDWFPWSGYWNGAGETDGYGDPVLADGPERFRDAYRHIIGLFRGERADTITWVFHVDVHSRPEEPWNNMAAYYPGDDYIDWIGVSVYGSQAPGDDWMRFTDLLNAGYPELAAISPSKPLALLEFGVAEDPPSGDKAQWIRDALASIRLGRYPRIAAVSYWQETWENGDGSISDLRIDSSPAALDAYREGVADPIFVTAARYSAGAARPDIKVNGADGPVELSGGDTVSLTVALDAGLDAGANADWAAAAATPFGWYSYDAWTASWLTGLFPGLRAPLGDLSPYRILEISGLPSGHYFVCFGFDTEENGAIDADRVVYDTTEMLIR